MRYLVNTVDVYRVDSEAEALELIEEAKKNSYYTLIKYSNEYKTKKEKGEIVDEWFKVTLAKSFTNEKEPDYQVKVNYSMDGAF